MIRWRVVLVGFEPWQSLALGLAPAMAAMFLVTGSARTMLPVCLLAGVVGGFLGAGIDTGGRRAWRTLLILGCAMVLAVLPLAVASR